MTLKALSLVLATTALVALNLPAVAEDAKGRNLGATAEGAAPGPAATMALAQDLHALGLQQSDAMTVLAAAKLAASVNFEEKVPAVLELSKDQLAALAFAKKTEPPSLPRPEVRQAVKSLAGEAIASLATVGTSAADETEGPSDAPLTAEQMFAAALELAGDDDMLIGLIEDAQAEGTRGRIGGGVNWLSRLPAGMSDYWEIPFYGNSYAEIAIAGDGDADLDVAVTDENGNVICYDVSSSDRVYCDFTPAWDGYFYVTVQNVGSSRNSYYLMTN